MDDPISIPLDRCVIRQCEVSRLESQLLARAYQQIFPQLRLSLVKAQTPAPPVSAVGPHSNSAVVAAGA